MDLHARFDDWLADGAEGEPPRDLALHASACDGCLRAVAVVESLQAVRVGAAELPPLRFVAGWPRPFRVARMAVGPIAVVLLALSVGIGASGLLRTAPAAEEPVPTPTAEGVLAGRPTAEATDPSASPSPTPSPTETPTPSPSATATPSPDPTVAPVPPAPRTAAPLPPPPQPTAAPPTPAPTEVPTAPPIPPPPTPTPSPSPTPSPTDTPSEPPPPTESPPASPEP